MRLDLRRRVALWCAGLVIASGVIVVLLVVLLSGRLLRERNQASRPKPPPGQVIPRPTPEEQARKQASEAVFRDVRLIGLGTVGGLAVVAVGVAWLVAGRIVRPIGKMTDTARSIAADRRLDRRIGLDGPRDELHELADAFDRMLDRLEVAFEGQRSFVANTSHELRTPLAVMRTEVEVALDDREASPADLRDALRAIGSELERTVGLVEAMLALARAEVLVGVAPVDLAEQAQAAVAGLAADVRADRSIELELAPAPLVGDPILLGRLVANLVQNAGRYNRSGGRLRVATSAATTSSAGRQARLLVENDGPPVDPGDVALLFERFRRRSEAGEGHGLGMAIVAAIVASHGGTVQAWARPEGGLRVEVALPVAR